MMILDRLLDPWVRALVGLLAVGQVGDVMTTLIALHGGAQEVNPLVNAFGGVGPLSIIVKLLIVTGVVIVDLAIIKSACMLRWALGFAVCITWAVVISNAVSTVQ